MMGKRGSTGGQPRRLGIVYTPALPPEGLLAAARAADAAGLDEFWVWEDCFAHGGLASATAALTATERITVGIGLLPVPLRNVAITAMELATLHRLFPGRLLAGVGHGVQDWMGQVGARVESPMGLLAEYVDALRALLDGRTVTTGGRYLHLRDVTLQWPPAAADVRILVGGQGPNTLRFSARHGDGTLLAAAMSAAEISSSVAIVDTELAAPGARARSGHPVVANLIVARGADAERLIRAELERWGVADVPGVAARGTPEDIAGALGDTYRLGVTSVVVQPTADEPDLPGLIETLGAIVVRQRGQ